MDAVFRVKEERVSGLVEGYVRLLLIHTQPS